jgi:hypothetical protein
MLAGHNVAPTVHTVVTDQLTGRDIWKGKREWVSPKVRCVGGATSTLTPHAEFTGERTVPAA